MSVQPVSKRLLPYTDAGDTTAIIGSFKSGKTMFTCLATQAGNKYTPIIAKGKMLRIKDSKINLQQDCLNGWFKPKFSIVEFLEEYSRNGGIHHAALVYNGEIDILKIFGRYMGWNVVVTE